MQDGSVAWACYLGPTRVLERTGRVALKACVVEGFQSHEPRFLVWIFFLFACEREERRVVTSGCEIGRRAGCRMTRLGYTAPSSRTRRYLKLINECEEERYSVPYAK